MIFFLSCISTHQVVRTSIPPQTLKTSIQEQDIPLQYDIGKIRALNEKEKELFPPSSAKETEDIWTLSPYPKPSIRNNPTAYPIVSPQIIPYEEQNKSTSYHIHTMRQEEHKKSVALSKNAQISGPQERISSDIVILRTQMNESNGGTFVEWRNTISAAPCPVSIEGYDCTPPSYNISYSSEHSSPLDSFSYTQFSFRPSEAPVPFYVHSTIKNTQEESTHHTLIHPASIYIGLSAPYWSEENKILAIQSKIVEINGHADSKFEATFSIIEKYPSTW